MLSGVATHSYAVVHGAHFRRRGAGVQSGALRQAARLMTCSAKPCMVASHPCCRLMQSCVRLRAATGYALSIFIPVSCVCVLPYEAVRWALIGVATLTSGLFLLLNFRGPIFDVAGAKCAPLPGCQWQFCRAGSQGRCYLTCADGGQVLFCPWVCPSRCLGKDIHAWLCHAAMLSWVFADLVAYPCGCCLLRGLPV